MSVTSGGGGGEPLVKTRVYQGTILRLPAPLRKPVSVAVVGITKLRVEQDLCWVGVVVIVYLMSYEEILGFTAVLSGRGMKRPVMI